MFNKTLFSEDLAVLRSHFVYILVFVLSFTFVSTSALAQSSAENANVDELIYEGSLYYSRGDCDLSQYIFQEALKLEPSNPDAMLGKARALVCLGALELGIEEYRKVLAVTPQNINAHVHLANTYRAQYAADPQNNSSSLDQALATVQSAEQIAPSDPRVLNIKGVVYYQRGDLESAKIALER